MEGPAHADYDRLSTGAITQESGQSRTANSVGTGQGVSMAAVPTNPEQLYQLALNNVRLQLTSHLQHPQLNNPPDQHPHRRGRRRQASRLSSRQPRKATTAVKYPTDLFTKVSAVRHIASIVISYGHGAVMTLRILR